MKMSTARRIDLVAGYLICSFLRLLFGRRKQATELHSPPKNILVLKCFGFGSIVQMTPMLHAIKEHYPNSSTTLFTFSPNKQLQPLITTVDHWIAIDRHKGLFSFVLQSWRAWRELRRQHFELIFDCEFFSYYVSMLVQLLRWEDTVTIGFFKNRKASDWIFSHNIAIDLSQHIACLFLKMIQPLTKTPMTARQGLLHIPPDALEAIQKVLQDAAIDPQRHDCLVVNINSSDLCYNRRWPRDHYQGLLTMLLENDSHPRPIRIIFTGTQEEAAYIQPLLESLPAASTLNLAGKITIPQLAALLHLARLYLGNDSGPLHLAAACGIPTVSIFGPETPALYGPQGPMHHIHYAQLPCSPCLNIFYSKETHCTENRCMKTIEAQEVLTSILQCLKDNDTTPTKGAL